MKVDLMNNILISVIHWLKCQENPIPTTQKEQQMQRAPNEDALSPRLKLKAGRAIFEYVICIVSNFPHKLTPCWQVYAAQLEIRIKCGRTLRKYIRLSVP